MRIAFDRFVLDLDQRQLSADGTEIRLAPKAFDLLRLLVEQRPRAMAKEEILGAIWPDTFVTENSLATHVADLRSALGDHVQSPRFIRTVYAFGYAFIAAAGPVLGPVVPVPVPAAWRLLHGQREILLDAGQNVVGRGGPGIIPLESPTVSRRHAAISIDNASATVEDLGSKNGTWLGMHRVTRPVAAQDGDQLRFGSVVVILRYDRDTQSTLTVTYPARFDDDTL